MVKTSRFLLILFINFIVFFAVSTVSYAMPTEFLHKILDLQFEGRYAKALTELTQYIRENPEDVEGYIRSAETYYMMGAYSSAIEKYDKALKLDPTDPFTYKGRAEALFQEDLYDEAINDFLLADSFKYDFMYSTWTEQLKEKLELAKYYKIQMETSPANKALLLACEEGDWELAEMMLKQGANANLLDKTGTPIIIGASLNRFNNVVKALLSYGAKPDVMKIERSTPLYNPLGIAVEIGDIDLVRILIEGGADPNFPSDYPPISRVCFFGDTVAHLEILKLLLTSGGSPNHQNSAGISPLMAPMLAYSELYFQKDEKLLTQFLTTLIEANADVNVIANDGRTALSIALDAKKTQAVKTLINAGAKF